jgi:preprotein translocase subunit SecG
MSIVITVVHVVACFFLIVVVLLQTGKGADIGAVFGGSSQTIFGSGGAGNLLTRLTTWTAAIFMLSSLLLTWGSTRHLTASVVDAIPTEPPPISEPAPLGDGAALPGVGGDASASASGDSGTAPAEGAATGGAAVNGVAASGAAAEGAAAPADSTAPGVGAAASGAAKGAVAEAGGTAPVGSDAAPAKASGAASPAGGAAGVAAPSAGAAPANP